MDAKPLRLTVSEFLSKELTVRGWGLSELSERSGLPADTVRHILGGLKILTIVDAEGLARALGTPANIWLELDVPTRPCSE